MTHWLIAAMITLTAAAGGPFGCEGIVGFDRLDFWIGEWDVLVDDERVGRNRIEKILDGCAVMEHWEDSQGGLGKSLFFFQPATGEWKQVWVTESASRTGGVKEKKLLESFAGPGVRFQGEIPLPEGGRYLDRTTLTAMPDGSVRQVIEVSRDGADWRVTFDALYVRRR